MAHQSMVFAEKWTKDVKWFGREVQHMPIVLFNSYYEASIAFGVKCNVEMIRSEEQREEAIASLVFEISQRKSTPNCNCLSNCR